MEKQERSLPLEPSLTDLILNPNSDKIRRPPNAFMIFAREQRKNLAHSHPDVSNKVISSMLGQMWKNTPEYVKAKYYQKSQELRDLHKSRYPGYIYSPREARLQKMKRKMKKNSMNEVELGSFIKKEMSQKEAKKERDRVIPAIRDVMSCPQYVPNNPHINEYAIPERPGIDANEDGDPGQEMFDQSSSNLAFEQQNKTGEMPMQVDQEGFQEARSYDWSRASERCRCYQKEYLACKNESTYPYKREVPFRFPNHPQHPYAVPASLYGPAERFPGMMNPFCCGPPSCNSPLPRSYDPSIHPYWNPTIMNSGYLQSGDGVYGHPKSFSYATGPYNFSRPSLGYFDRFASPMMNTSDPSLYPPAHEDWGYLRRYRQEFITNNPELRPCRRNTSVQNISNENACSSNDGRAKLQNWRVQTTYEQNKGPPHSINNLEPITEEMPDLSPYSQDESSANRLQICESNKQEYFLNRDSESMRMKSSYICNFQNGNLSDVSNHNEVKTNDRLDGPYSSNVEQVRSENTTMSSSDRDLSQFPNENDYKNAYARMYGERQDPEKKFGNQSNVAPYGYTKSYPRNTESNAYLPNNQFQGKNYGPLRQKSGIVSPVNSNVKDSNSFFKMNDNSGNITEDSSTVPFTNIPEKTSSDTASAIKLEDNVEEETNIKNGTSQFHFYEPLDAEAISSGSTLQSEM